MEALAPVLLNQYTQRLFDGTIPGLSFACPGCAGWGEHLQWNLLSVSVRGNSQGRSLTSSNAVRYHYNDNNS
jgi:hypothetical protein